MVKFLKEKTDLTRISSVLSLFTLVAFHWPFFRLVLGNIEGGFNGVLITGGLGVLMFALNFLVYYLVLFLGRFVGKCILAFTFIGNAISLYFINTYQVLITDKMMGNVFNTRYSEASGFFSWSAVWYLLFLGVVPCIYIFARRFDYGSWKRFFARTGIALAVSLAIALVNMQNWPWIDRNAPKLGSLVMPWSYTVNSVRYYNSVKKQNRKEIPLPDAKIVSDSKDVCVLIIGESARRENFSLYGYGKPTNPLLEKDSVTALIADAAATYTTAGVKAILDHKPSNKLYEILPNYLNRSGVDVVWRSNNWGEPPVTSTNTTSRKSSRSGIPKPTTGTTAFCSQASAKRYSPAARTRCSSYSIPARATAPRTIRNTRRSSRCSVPYALRWRCPKRIRRS